jgi:hypothetical protein
MENQTIHQDELEFIFYKQGNAGSFREGLYNLYWKADTFNKLKLESAFSYLWVARKYSSDQGYWEELQQRMKLSKIKQV